MEIPKENGFTAVEYQRRLAAVRAQMADREIDRWSSSVLTTHTTSRVIIALTRETFSAVLSRRAASRCCTRRTTIRCGRSSNC